MKPHKTRTASCILAFLILLPTVMVADEPSSRRRRLTGRHTDLDKLHRIVLPQDNELKWLSIPWLTSITQARHRAAVEGKPLFVFADTGAGFADALGLC